MTNTPGRKKPRLRNTSLDRSVLLAVAALAIHSRYCPCSVPVLAGFSEFSCSYLEKLLCQLRDRGIVKSVRGTLGGYILARDPTQITVSEIITAAGHATLRPPKENFNGSKYCASVDTAIAKVEELRHAILLHITLQDVISGRAATHPFVQRLLRDARGN